MPFKSEAQRRKFLFLVREGKMSQEMFDKWQAETGDAKLPERLGKVATARDFLQLENKQKKELNGPKKKLEPGTLLYHLTPTRNLKRIQRYGLRPRSSRWGESKRRSHSNRVYFTTTPESSLSMVDTLVGEDVNLGSRKKADKYALVVVDPTKVKGFQARVDPEEPKFSVYNQERIRPIAITEIRQGTLDEMFKKLPTDTQKTIRGMPKQASPLIASHMRSAIRLGRRGKRVDEDVLTTEEEELKKLKKEWAKLEKFSSEEIAADIAELNAALEKQAEKPPLRHRKWQVGQAPVDASNPDINILAYVVGPSGAGKTTFSKNKYADKFTVLHIDDYENFRTGKPYRIDSKKLADDVISATKPVIIEGMHIEQPFAGLAQNKIIVNPGRDKTLTQRIGRGRKLTGRRTTDDTNPEEGKNLWRIWDNEVYPEAKKLGFREISKITQQEFKKAASLAIRVQEEANMKKKAGIEPIQPIQQVQQLGTPAQMTAKQQQRQEELDAWGRWKQDQNTEDFGFLLERMKPFMYGYMGKRFLQTSNLPESAVKADLVLHFHRALETYDPNKGAQLNTHIGNHLPHTGRFLRTYHNIGKIPEPRARQIGMFQARQEFLREALQRDPTAEELADDMGISMKEITLLRKELRDDIIVEQGAGNLGGNAQMSPKALEQVTFLHHELNPNQQLVLEHTYGLFGKPEQPSNESIAQEMGITAQKVRAVKRQIAKKFEKRYPNA